jgi:hypothetical protein
VYLRNQALEAVASRARTSFSFWSKSDCYALRYLARKDLAVRNAFLTINISDFDLILGCDWLEKVNPAIDWNSDTISFTWNHHPFLFHTLPATGRISTALGVTESDTLGFCDWQQATTESKTEGAIGHIFTVKRI